MLDLTRTRIENSMTFPISSLTNGFEDGTALNGIFSNGVREAGLTANPANTDLFVGVSFMCFTTPTTYVQVDQITVPSASPYTATLTYTPDGSDYSASYESDNTALTETTVANIAAAGDYNITGSTITFDSADAGKIVNVQYRYKLTVQQAQTLAGVGVPGGVYPSSVTRSIGVIQRGLIYTSQYDTTVDWGSVTSIKCANGLFTDSSATGAPVTGYVHELPSATQPTLGLMIRA